MTVREFAKSVNFEVVGKLSPQYMENIVYDPMGVPHTIKEKFWIDEAGNEYYKGTKNSWCIFTKDGGVY